MRKLYTLMIVLTMLAFTGLKAQLNPGDLVFTGYISSGASQATDKFSFVPLVTLPVNTLIKFTDNGWNSSTNSFTSGETVVSFTVTGNPVPAGREITITPQASTARYTNGTSAGTVSSSGAAFALSTTGDQIIAYQGPDNTPTGFITGIQMNGYVGGCGANSTALIWDDVCNIASTNASTKPSTLTSGTNALWFATEAVLNSEVDNAVFICTGGITTTAALRAAANDKNNWYSESPGGSEASFTLPAGCAFLGLTALPVGIADFTGQLNPDRTVTLKWNVTDQQNVTEYIIEESRDGLNFSQIASEPRSAFTQYTYIDGQVSTGKTFYRLKIVENGGRTSFSNIISVDMKAGVVVSVYPNPAKDKITIQQFGGLHNRSAVIFDTRGKTMQSVVLNSQQQQIVIESYPKGVYIVKLEDGSIFKIVKQ